MIKNILYVYDIKFSSINTSAASGLSSGSLTLSLDPSTSSSQTCYVGGKIKITSGNAIGQIRTISSQSGNDVTIDKAFTTAIGSSDTLSIDFSTKEIESFTQSDNSKHYKISQYRKGDRLDQEISRLADSSKGDSNITNAIKMANEGKTIEEISQITGMTKEEIEPIIKFHGK